MNRISIQPHTTAAVHHHRPLRSVRDRLVAGAGVTLAAVAIAAGATGSMQPLTSPLASAAAVEAVSPWWSDPAQHPANQDLPRSANRAGVAPSPWWADPAQHPANQDAPRSAVDTTGEAPTLWWAERR